MLLYGYFIENNISSNSGGKSDLTFVLKGVCDLLNPYKCIIFKYF